MARYYNVYTGSTPQGPWTKANTTPILDVAAGNSYRITGLTNGQLYYIMVVAGHLVEGEFVALCSQTITPGVNAGIEISNPNLIASKPVDLT